MIETNDQDLKRILRGSLPVLLYLHDGLDKHKATTDAVRKLAKKHDGEIAVAHIDATQNPTTHAKYKDHDLPAVITLEQQFFGVRVKSATGTVRPADVRAHAAFLLDQGPDPAEINEKQVEKKTEPAGSKDTTDRQFKRDVLKSKTPVLVDFWAPWCGPCATVSPMLEKLGREYRGKLRVMKVNVDENPSLSRKYNIQSIPTMMIFQHGEMVAMTYGAQSERHMRNMIEDALLS